MEKAFKVWWYISWRTGLTVYILTVISQFIIAAGVNLYGLETSVVSIISIYLGVVYVKKALEKDYKDFKISITDKV